MRTVAIELDRPRKLRLESNAIADAEERLGMGLRKLMHQEMSFSMIRVMLWAGLKWQDPRLNPDKVGKLMNNYMLEGGTLEELGLKINEAILNSGLFNVDDDTLLDDEEESPNSEPETVTT